MALTLLTIYRRFPSQTKHRDTLFILNYDIKRVQC